MRHDGVKIVQSIIYIWHSKKHMRKRKPPVRISVTRLCASLIFGPRKLTSLWDNVLSIAMLFAAFKAVSLMLMLPTSTKYSLLAYAPKNTPLFVSCWHIAKVKSFAWTELYHGRLSSEQNLVSWSWIGVKTNSLSCSFSPPTSPPTSASTSFSPTASPPTSASTSFSPTTSASPSTSPSPPTSAAAPEVDKEVEA